METLLAEHRAYCLSYGWVSEKESMATAIDYNHKRRDFFHVFSAKSIGETFGRREYDVLIPLKDYMDSPMHLIEDLLEGVAEGKRKAKVAAEQAVKNKMGNLSPEQIVQKQINREMQK